MKQFNHTLGKMSSSFDRESHLPLAPILFDIPRDLNYWSPNGTG